MTLAQVTVCINPTDCPPEMSGHPEFWYGQQLRKAGVPMFERSLHEGPHRGVLKKIILEGGSLLFRWTDEERRYS